ncbi:hypothetical protein ACFYVL_43715 [Streptomyces sp. NPDC004111]|uniref:hypothetical protein n=1 Tax=Streptomyces sp. NPDC004111 TaxID=3364690 RepID=UPI00369DB20D
MLVQARVTAGIHTQEKFVDAFQKKATELGVDAGVTVRQIRRWESSRPGWPHPPARTVLTALLGRSPEELGFQRRPRNLAASGGLGPAHDEGVNRRVFMTRSATAVGAAVLPMSAHDLLAAPPTDPASGIRDVLTGTLPRPSQPSSVESIVKATASAKRQVQACRYSQLAVRLPGLLVEFAEPRESEEEQRQLDIAAVHAFHVAASLLLKAEDSASAWIAAERAMAAARRVDDPALIAAASRSLTQAVAAVGHKQQAIRIAIVGADQLSGGVTGKVPARAAVFGALLLRGAWAAAVGGDADTSAELLDESARAAKLLDESSNLQWTAFGQQNVQQHRLSIALTLGNAGQALDAARKVDVTQLAVTERRAVYWMDVARALHLCGQPDKAVSALLKAEKEAEEEVLSRPVVKELIGEMIARDRAGRLPALRELASRAAVQV